MQVSVEWLFSTIYKKYGLLYVPFWKKLLKKLFLNKWFIYQFNFTIFITKFHGIKYNILKVKNGV